VGIEDEKRRVEKKQGRGWVPVGGPLPLHVVRTYVLTYVLAYVLTYVRMCVDWWVPVGGPVPLHVKRGIRNECEEGREDGGRRERDWNGTKKQRKTRARETNSVPDESVW